MTATTNPPRGEVVLTVDAEAGLIDPTTGRRIDSVWGTPESGQATLLAALDQDLEALLLRIDGRLYRLGLALDATATPPAGPILSKYRAAYERIQRERAADA